MPICQAAQNDVEKLREYLEFANNRLPNEPGLKDAFELVKIAAAQITDQLRSDSYMKAPQASRCCHPHFADLEAQVRSLPWPTALHTTRDELIDEIKTAYQRAVNNSEYC